MGGSSRLRGQGSLAVEKVTYSLLCMVMDDVRLSFQVGGDLDCSYEHATVGMSLGHFGWTCSASEDGSSIKRKGESIYVFIFLFLSNKYSSQNCWRQDVLKTLLAAYLEARLVFVR